MLSEAKQPPRVFCYTWSPIQRYLQPKANTNKKFLVPPKHKSLPIFLPWLSSFMATSRMVLQCPRPCLMSVSRPECWAMVWRELFLISTFGNRMWNSFLWTVRSFSLSSRDKAMSCFNDRTFLRAKCRKIWPYTSEVCRSVDPRSNKFVFKIEIKSKKRWEDEIKSESDITWCRWKCCSEWTGHSLV